MNKKVFISTISFIVLVLSPYSYAYDNKTTHKDITNEAAKRSDIDIYLKNNLGFLAGREEKINGKMIIDWLSEGSYLEDVPNCRASNHFHNPLLLWSQSYMTDQPWWLDVACFDWKPWYSNVTWATSYLSLSPPPGGTKASFSSYSSYSPITWDRARDYYYKALTLTVQADRDIYAAWTFQAVGRVLHLLEDMAVPAHTRNDFTSHLIFNGIKSLNPKNWVIQPYEHYVKVNPTLVASATPVFPSFTNLRLTDFWDTNQYNGGNPSTSLSIGLAEFSNANYFSDSTIPSNNPTVEHSFPYPQVNLTNSYICEDFLPGSSKPTKYLSRIPCPTGGTGTVDHFAAISFMNRADNITNSNIQNLKVWLDDNVHNTYAKELIPRAVGYSAGLLNYFFRGTLEITPPAQVAYAVTDGSQTPYVDNNGNLHQQFTSIKAKVRNSTPDTIPGEEVQNCDQLQENCILQAIARYKIIPDYQNDLSNYPPDGTTMQNTEYSYSVSVPKYIDSLSSTTPQEFTFYFTTDPVPAGITDLHLFIVFKGTLGNETDIAIAVGKKDLMEPTHQVLWNLTDMFSLDNHLYTSDTIKTTPALAARVDFDGDGIFNETNIGEPYIDSHATTFGIGYLKEPPGPVNPFTYSAITVVQPGRHIRAVVLVDKSQNNYLVLEESDAVSGTSYYYFASPGVVNQEENGVWQTPTPITTFRYGLDIDGVTHIPIRQHYSNGVLKCYPIGGIDPYGNPVCSYPENEAIPAQLSPSPIDTVYFP